MAEARTVTLPDVMQALDLAGAPEAEFQAALTQAVQRVATEQGLTLNAERVALAAQVVHARHTTDALPALAPTQVSEALRWAQRPAHPEEHQRRLAAYSTGWRGWLRRTKCDDQGREQHQGRHVLCCLGMGALILTRPLTQSWVPFGLLVGMGAAMVTAMLMAEHFEYAFKRLLPATLTPRLRAQLMADPEAAAAVQQVEGSALPTLLEGDLDVLVRHWLRQVGRMRT